MAEGGRPLEGPRRRPCRHGHRAHLATGQRAARGILPLAPTFAIIPLLAVGAKGEAEGFRAVCLAGAETIPAYLVFLGTVCAPSGGDYRLAILGGLGAWLVAGLLIFLGPRLL